jgi:hypothetical protein
MSLFLFVRAESCVSQSVTGGKIHIGLSILPSHSTANIWRNFLESHQIQIDFFISALCTTHPRNFDMEVKTTTDSKLNQILMLACS